MRYRVVHRTRYAYAEPVSASYGQHHLLPRATPTQQVLASTVNIAPAPSERRERTDVHGNRVEYYALYEDHTELVVSASSTVDVVPPVAVAVDAPWDRVREELRSRPDVATIEARPYVLDSPQVAASDALRELSAPCFAPGRPLFDAYVDLVSLLHREFEFDATATTVTTDIDEVLRRRAGVCQDFAHVLLGCLRSYGLPARYVSGYIETDPPPGRPRLQGADASHAWVSLYLPDHGWVDADPTNDTLVGERHVTVAWGRDYGDVAPLKGVIYTEGPTTELDVAVDVIRVDDEAPLDDGAPARPA